jgi:MarR family 2-MHQ and catechol resistance regulon transcriptional repressor
MTALDRKADELRLLVGNILEQFRLIDAVAAEGPHVELSCQELTLVEHLGDSGPRMMRELAEFLLLAVNTVTGIVDKLEARGVVRRRRSAEDRRVVHVELTDAGQEAYRAALEDKMRLLRSMLRALTEDEQEIFLVLFRKIARAGRSQVQKIASPA